MKFRKSSIKLKIFIVVGAAIWGASFLNILYTTGRSYIHEFRNLEREATSIAEYAAFNSAPSVVFGDAVVLGEALTGILENPMMVYGAFTDKQGTLLASRTRDEFVIQTPLPRPQTTWKSRSFERIDVAVPIRDAGELVGYLYLGISPKTSIQQIRLNFWLALGFNALLGVVIFLMLVWLISRFLLRPIAVLHQGTLAIAGGHFREDTIRSRIKTEDEVGALAHSFCEMAKSLEQQSNEIREQNQKLLDREKKLHTAVDFLSTYLPKQFVTSVMEETTHSSVTTPQRRRLTVFFSDLQGFTSLTDSLDPELLFQMLNQYQNAMTQLVHRYDGTLDKYMGDGLMVFFGTPVSRGAREDTLRCCLMALEMQQAMVSVRKSWYLQGIETPLDVRIGIHAGYATVGSFGTETRLNYTAIGQAVNIASRLESHCPPGKILISHQTWAHIQQLMKTEAYESFTPKGFLRPMKSYILQGVQHDLPSRLRSELSNTEMIRYFQQFILKSEALETPVDKAV